MMWLAALILAIITLAWAVVDRTWQLALLAAAVILLALVGAPHDVELLR